MELPPFLVLMFFLLLSMQYMLCFDNSQSWCGSAFLGYPKLGNDSLALWVTIRAFAMDSKCLSNLPTDMTNWSRAFRNKSAFLANHAAFAQAKQLIKYTFLSVLFGFFFLMFAWIPVAIWKMKRFAFYKTKQKPNPDKEWLSACGNSIRASLIHNKNAFYSSEKGKGWKLPCW